MIKTRMLTPVALLSLLLTACGGGGGGDSAQESQTPTEPSIVRTTLSILIPSAEAADLPSESSVSVRISGQGTTETVTMTDFESGVTFDDLLPGQYSVSLTARSEGVVVATGQQTVTLSANGNSFTVPMNLIAADLTISTEINGPDYSFLNKQYRGEAIGESCGANPFMEFGGTAGATTTLTISGENISINMSLFGDPNIIFTGTITDDTNGLQASGTFESSNFKEGTWVLNELRSPRAGVVYMDITLSGECDGTVLVFGF